MAATQEQGSSALNTSTEGIDRSWYVSRKKIEEDSPSRRDGIALEVENVFRISYSNFLEELGAKLNLHEQTIATATVYCHRFFLRQSHKNNNKWTIAMACMFLVCKHEETRPPPVEKLVKASCEIIRKYGPAPPPTITEEVIKEGVKRVLKEEKLVLTTLGFGIFVLHPYQCLLDTLKKFLCTSISSMNAMRQHAWDYAIETWLKTSLCLQYKPEHIAGAAIYLAMQCIKEGVLCFEEKVWWHELDLPFQRLKDIAEHMLEEYANIQKPLSPEFLGNLGVRTANLYKRDREKREEFTQWLNFPDEPELKYPADHEKDDRSDHSNGNQKCGAVEGQ